MVRAHIASERVEAAARAQAVARAQAETEWLLEEEEQSRIKSRIARAKAEAAAEAAQVEVARLQAIQAETRRADSEALLKAKLDAERLETEKPCGKLTW